MPNKFTFIVGTEQGSAPATPGTGEWAFYFKSDGLYIIDDAGVEYGPFGGATPAGRLTVTVRNETGGTLTQGTPVYVSGFNVGADLPEVTAADASSSATLPAIGLVNADITTGSSGTVVVAGRLDDFDTSSFTEGDLLYVSTTAGALTATKPTGADLVQLVAEVLRSNVSNGQLLVNVATTVDTGFIETLLDDGDAATARATLGALGLTPTLTEYADTVNALAYAATVTPDPADGMWITITLTGNVTINLSNMTAGQTLVFDITQDGTGSRTVGFTQTVEWPGGTAFTATTTAGARDRIMVDYDGTTYTGHPVGQDYS